MNPLNKLFKQTFIYGLATVLPRMLTFLLLPLYTKFLEPNSYGVVTVIFSWFAIFNVLLAYGMETAFFRFYHSADNRKKMVSTSLLSLLGSTVVFLVLALTFQDRMAQITEIDAKYIQYAIWILVLDALVIIPFAWLRANEKAMRYALVKLVNVVFNIGLNIFFIRFLPQLVQNDPDSFWATIYRPDFEISYIFISNLISSSVTLLMMLRLYIRRPYAFDFPLWKNMIKYAMPVMVAGIAFTINEVFDKILLAKLLPEGIADSEVGKYAACYKLAMFMTLFATAFRMGIEPFFFSHSTTQNPQKAYAQITNYFVVLGSVILLAVVVYADVLKLLFVRNPAYWEAMSIVPLIVLANFFLGIYHNLSVWYKVTDQTKFGAYISLIGALLTIMINYALIPSMSYMASAIATLIAYGSMMALSFYFGRKYYPVPYNFRKIYFYLTISILFSTVSFYLFDRNIWVGSFLLFVFLALVFKMEREKLTQIFLRK